MTKPTNLRAEIVSICTYHKPNGWSGIYLTDEQLDAIIEAVQKHLDSIELPEKEESVVDYSPEFSAGRNSMRDDCAAVIKEFKEGL